MANFQQFCQFYWIILLSKPNFPGFPTFFPGKREIENREISREFPGREIPGTNSTEDDSYATIWKVKTHMRNIHIATDRDWFILTDIILALKLSHISLKADHPPFSDIFQWISSLLMNSCIALKISMQKNNK